MDKGFKKREILLLAVVFVILLLIFLGYVRMRGNAQAGGVVRITVAGETYGEYSLNEDQEIPIDSGNGVTNILVISDGRADMTEADCPDQICVNMQPISVENETIICLPNKIVVEVISSDKDGDFDVIVQ